MKEDQLTETWKQYQKGKEYLGTKDYYSQTNKNNRFYLGDQWDDKQKDLAMSMPVMNIIKPICDYKIGIVAQNNMVINYSSENFNESEMDKLDGQVSFKNIADKTMDLLNKYAAKVWENNNLESEMWNFVKESCVSGTANAYFYTKDNKEIMEMVDGNNIYFSDENDPDIQNQEYILITFRRPVEKVREEAKENGLSDSLIEQIVADTDTNEQLGNKEEVQTDSGKCLCILKLYKKEVSHTTTEIDTTTNEFGEEIEKEREVKTQKTTVHIVKSTKNVKYVKETDLKLTLYPISKLNWIEEKGNSRGRGEPQSLLNNQIEINKTLARRLLAVTMTAYPKLTYLQDKIAEPSKLDKVGVGIGITGQSVQDVRNAIDYLRPAQISPDAKQINDELQVNTKELAGAGDVALGNVDPTQASGRAIIAVKDASSMPLNSQVAKFRKFVEDIGRIWFDMWQNTATEGKTVVFDESDEDGQVETRVEQIPYELLQKLKVNIRIDVSNANPFNKFSQEQTLENLFMGAKAITFEEYVEALPNDSVAPKSKLEGIIKKRQEKSKQIADIESQVQQEQFKIDGMVQNKQDSKKQEIDSIEQDMLAQQDDANQMLGGGQNEVQSV